MKFYPSFLTSSKSLTNILAVAGIALMFTACKNDDTPTPEIAALAVTYAVPDGEPINFYLDNNRPVNSSPFTFGTKVDYFQAYQGSRNARVLVADDNEELINEDITLEKGEYYSLYIVNKAADAEYLLVNDKIENPVVGSAKVRFINLVPDGPAYDLEIEGDTTSFKNKEFKAYTLFKDVAAKDDVTLLLKDAAGDIKVTLSDVDLKEGKIYTIWAKGLVTTTETAQELEIKVAQN